MSEEITDLLGFTAMQRITLRELAGHDRVEVEIVGVVASDTSEPDPVVQITDTGRTMIVGVDSHGMTWGSNNQLPISPITESMINGLNPLDADVMALFAVRASVPPPESGKPVQVPYGAI